MTHPNLLVELFVEELPPKALQKLGDAFGAVLLEQLQAQGLAAAHAQLTAYASPRRLAAHITEVAPQAADKAVSQKLMPVAVGLDASGQPTPALLKKLAALGADASAVPALKRVDDGKAEVLFFESTAKGALLAEGWVVHASRSLCSCAAQLLDEDGKLVATATGTFKYWLAPTTLDRGSARAD
jgi:glycyl-tRNA synthetase beta chain